MYVCAADFSLKKHARKENIDKRWRHSFEAGENTFHEKMA